MARQQDGDNKMDTQQLTSNRWDGFTFHIYFRRLYSHKASDTCVYTVKARGYVLDAPSPLLGIKPPALVVVQ